MNCQTSLRVSQIRLFETLFMELVVPILVQGVPRHWTPGNLAKSQAIYKIRHLENFQVSSSCLAKFLVSSVVGHPVPSHVIVYSGNL